MLRQTSKAGRIEDRGSHPGSRAACFALFLEML
jgi:hypothetical protein